MSAVSPARKAAFGILLAVERGRAHSHAHSDDLLRRKEVSALAPADRNLATTLVLGVLRWQIRLDEQLKSFLKRPGSKLDREVRIALRLGAFQLLFLDRIPAHAAIDESVELAKHSGYRFAAGMVNAVLRKLDSGAGADAPRFDSLEKTPAELAMAQAHPAWLVERWAEFYGMEAAHAICRHGQSQPVLTLRMEDPAVEAELTQASIQLEPSAFLAATRSVVSGDASVMAAVREGRARVQDEGSQLIAELAACAGENLDGNAKRILDACAAPGGKTLVLAERKPEAQIVACESSPQRLAALRKRLAAYADRVECRLADATALKDESVFDVVLADVPCSGTGTLGRNPEIRHRLRLEDLLRQAERQRAILGAALRAVRRGGRVVYSTCSLEPEENEQVVAAVLAENPNARQVSFVSCIQSLQRNDILAGHGAERLQKCPTPEGALRLLPGVFPSDGFFVALIEKTA
jgi:16S rRNA (cytosine967-C5)-methyltransferase